MDPRYIMIGGFLGAGKTTTVARLARHYLSQGLNVAIVTNDQAADLVDTQSLRSQGFDVGEVAGACFCCNFNELTATVEQMSEASLPDVILAEPVGSCTDLVATVIRPLVQVYQRPLDVAPYGVILKPSHGLRILSGSGAGGFSPKAEYIFRKQLEEADFLIVNRIDEMSPDQLRQLTELLNEQYPGRAIVKTSARTGDGFDSLIEYLDQRGSFGKRVMDVDYQIYAEGEAELGWLNSQVTITGSTPFSLDDFLLELISGLGIRLSETGAETAHLKTIGLTDGGYAVANLVSSFTAPELSLASAEIVNTAHVVVNARVAIDPDVLSQLVTEQLAQVCEKRGLACQVDTLQCFRPGKPVPIHRLDPV